MAFIEAVQFPGLRERRSWSLALGLILAASACSESTTSSASISPPKTAPIAHQRMPELPRPKVDFVLVHYPAIGPKTFVEAYSENEARVLRITRTVQRGLAAGWTLRFGKRGSKRVDALVSELSAGATVAASCPKRHGRDGVNWGVRNFVQGIEWGLTFEMKDRGPECARLEAAAVEMMRLANLKCLWQACLRPEEEASRRFTCAAGEDGRECREMPDGGY